MKSMKEVLFWSGCFLQRQVKVVIHLFIYVVYVRETKWPCLNGSCCIDES